MPDTTRTFTSCSRTELTCAFAIAHKMGETFDVPEPYRGKFREIARLIWEAHGEAGRPPQGAGVELLNKIEGAEVGRAEV